jgi:hypothetical protein
MRAAASIVITGTGADPAITTRLRPRFVRINDDGIGANALLMAVPPVGTAQFEMFRVDLDPTARLPDDAALQTIGLSQLPTTLARPTLTTSGEVVVASLVFAPGWYYFRQVVSAAGATRADFIPVVLAGGFTYP